MKSILIVFVKPPLPGEVKTRLMPYLDSKESAEVYSTFVKDVLRQTQRVSNAKVLVAYQHSTKSPDLTWTGMKPLPEFFKQEGKSLGERLAHAFGNAFGRGAKRIVIIGCDVPTLSHHVMDQAFKMLESNDIVLGPSTGGGYYLLGVSRPCLNLFADVCWSGDQVIERVLQKAQQIGYRLAELDAHREIHTVDDLYFLQTELSQNPDLAPLTAKKLSTTLKNKRLLSTI